MSRLHAGRLIVAGITVAAAATMFDAPAAFSAQPAAVPGAPTNVQATAGVGTIALTWTAPANNGGAAITSYKATCSTSGAPAKTATSTTTSTTVTGVTAGKPYTCTVAAINADGQGPASAPSDPVTPLGKPAAPQNVSLQAAASALTVKWLAPASNGGSAITAYGVACTSTDGGAAANGSTSGATTLTLPGSFTNKTYSCTVKATNSIGTGPTGTSNFAMWAAVTTTGGSATMHVPATAGKRGSVVISNVTPSACGPITQLKAPSGSTLGQASSCSSTGAFIDAVSLATTGTYTVVETMPAGVTGSASLQLYVFTDGTGTIKTNGPMVTAKTGSPGQRVLLTVALTAGQRVTMRTTTVTTGSCLPLSLLDSTSHVIESGCLNANGFIDAQDIPATGSYTLVVDPLSTDTGQAVIGVGSFTDLRGTVANNGATTTAKITKPGQRGYYTVSLTAGQQVTMRTAAVSMGVCVPLSLLDPNSHVVESGCLAANGFIDAQPVSLAGTYTVVVDPQGTDTGSAAFGVNTFTDVLGTVTANGPAKTVTISKPGQRGYFTVSLSSGHQVTMATTSVTTAACMPLSLLDPNNHVVESGCLGNNGFIDQQTTALTGTFTVVVDPQGTNTGSVTFTLNTFDNVTGTIAVNGATVSAALTHPGQRALYTFSGSAKQHVTVKAVNGLANCVPMTIQSSTGTNIASSCTVAGSTFAATLPSAGTYTLVVDPLGTDTGTQQVKLTSP